MRVLTRKGLIGLEVLGIVTVMACAGLVARSHVKGFADNPVPECQRIGAVRVQDSNGNDRCVGWSELISNSGSVRN